MPHCSLDYFFHVRERDKGVKVEQTEASVFQRECHLTGHFLLT